MSDTFADGVERLREAAAELPRLLDDAVEGVATYAAALSELIQNADTRRSALNEQAQRLGALPVPDAVDAYVPASDQVRAPLVAAARRGPAGGEHPPPVTPHAREPRPDRRPAGALASVRPQRGKGRAGLYEAAVLFARRRTAALHPEREPGRPQGPFASLYTSHNRSAVEHAELSMAQVAQPRQWSINARYAV